MICTVNQLTDFSMVETVLLIWSNEEAHSEPCPTSKMEVFEKIVNSSEINNFRKKLHN